MTSLSKIIFRLKNTKAQALLLVMVISLFSMALVLGVVERTNKQLIIQRQNAEYQIGFTNATTAIAGLKALIDNGTVVPGNMTNAEILSKLTGSDGLLPGGISSNDYKLNVLPFDTSQDVYSSVSPDSGLLVEQFKKERENTSTILDVSRVDVYCPTQYASLSTINNIAVNVQFVYRDTTDQKIKLENITSVCNETSNGINGGAFWATGINNINGTQIDVSNPTPITLKGINYNKISYSITNNVKKKILYVKAIPKVNFMSGNPSGSASTLPVHMIVKLYDGTELRGTSTPVQGTAIGYGKNGRNSTIYFKISNIPQQPPFFDYVLFEGS